MKLLQSDDDSGYISPASDEMESLCSRNSSHVGSLVSERKFEITFEVNDLIVVSSTVDVVSSNQSNSNDSLTSNAPNNFHLNSKYLETVNDEVKHNTDHGCGRQHHTHKSAKDANSDDFACYDTVELELVVEDLRQKSPDLNQSDKVIRNDKFRNDTTSSGKVLEEYRLPISNSLAMFTMYEDDISDQSGYISPASSEGDGREKLIRLRSSSQQDNDSTGYVSSISDDLSEEDDASTEVEQVIEAQIGNFYSINMDSDFKTENRDDILSRRSDDDCYAGGNEQMKMQLTSLLKSQNLYSQKSNFIINK